MHEFIELTRNIVTSTFFHTWLGAICAHILSLYSDEFKGTVPFLSKMFPNKSDTFYFRIDFLVLPCIGALIAFYFLEPVSLKSSLFAGLSWSGTLIALLKRKNAQLTKEENGEN